MKNEESTPIAYCDTSFLIEYWEATTIDKNDEYEHLRSRNEPEYFKFITKLLKSESKIERLKPFRKLVENDGINLKIISSVLALMEVFEKHAEWNFKSIITEATGVDRVLNLGKKRIGNMIQNISDTDVAACHMIHSALYPSHLEETFYGITFEGLDEFALTKKDFRESFGYLSVLQIGPMDILHLHAAIKLNATYFLTFDEDFKRVRNFIKKELGLKVIYHNHEIEQLSKKHKK